jgi:glyoxalase family protein
MSGLHHVTAIAGPAQRNFDFYARTLGLRLVKKTVNFDDPTAYHLYFGDEAGSPGTILTYFPWANAAPGRLGVGETEETRLRVPAASLGYWTHRFVAHGVDHGPIEKRFGASALPFKDPAGMRLALIGVADIEGEPTWRADVPVENAIRGLLGVSLMLGDAKPTAAILTDIFGLEEVGREGATTRFKGTAAMGAIIDLHEAGGFLPARLGAGSVHHIAFRAKDDAAQAAMVKKLAENHGLRTTEQKDRNYFRSVYFREPGHVLFEIATDIPGFAADEPADALGQALKLPSFLEKRRAELEAKLPALDITTRAA